MVGKASLAEVVLRMGVNTVATKGMLGDLNPLGDGPGRGLADHGARVPYQLAICK